MSPILIVLVAIVVVAGSLIVGFVLGFLAGLVETEELLRCPRYPEISISDARMETLLKYDPEGSTLEPGWDEEREHDWWTPLGMSMKRHDDPEWNESEEGLMK